VAGSPHHVFPAPESLLSGSGFIFFPFFRFFILVLCYSLDRVRLLIMKNGGGGVASISVPPEVVMTLL
jgi:hypothetical protein